MWRVGDPPGGTGMGDAATGGGQGSGGTSQGWRREDVVGGWMDERKDGRTGHRKQEKQKWRKRENNDKKNHN